MKCVAVSDIHMRDVRTPSADLLIVSGDMTMKGTPEEMSWFASWLDRQPAKHKVWIAGNHEMGIEETPDLAARIAFETDSVYLNDSEVEIEGVRIWGSPITPAFYDWAFNRQRGSEIRKHWDKNSSWARHTDHPRTTAWIHGSQSLCRTCRLRRVD